MSDEQVSHLFETLCLDDETDQEEPSFSQLKASLRHEYCHDSVVCGVRYSWDGTKIVTACNLAAYVFDAKTGLNLASLSAQTDFPPGGASYVRSACFTPDGKSLVTGGEDDIVKVWNLGSETIKYRLVGHLADVCSVDSASNNRFAASGSSDGSVKVWNLTTGDLMLTLNTECDSLGVTSVSISPTCRYIAAACIDDTVLVWDVESSKLVQKLEGHARPVYSVAFSPCERLLLSASLDKTLKVWCMTALSPYNCPLTLAGHGDSVLCASFSPCGSWLFSGSKDRKVRQWDPRQPTDSLHLQGHNSSVIAIAHSPTDPHFVTGCGDFQARTWLYNSNGTF